MRRREAKGVTTNNIQHLQEVFFYILVLYCRFFIYSRLSLDSKEREKREGCGSYDDTALTNLLLSLSLSLSILGRRSSNILVYW